MFCPNCGTKNKEEAKFCAKCGAALARASGAVAAPADAAVAIESAGKKWKLLAVAGIIAVLLIGGAYGVYTYSVDSRWGMQKEEAAPAPPPVDPNVVIADEARKSLSTYHEAITNHDFIQAYALMTSQKQSDLGTYEAWKDGYASTLPVRFWMPNQRQSRLIGSFSRINWKPVTAKAAGLRNRLSVVMLPWSGRGTCGSWRTVTVGLFLRRTNKNGKRGIL